MTKTPAKPSLDPRKPGIASREELNEFISGLAKRRKSVEHEEKTKQDEAARDYLKQFNRVERERLMGRAFNDALKSPSQKLGTAKAGSAEERKNPAPEEKGGGSEKAR